MFPEKGSPAIKAPLFLSPRNAKTLKRVFPLTTPRTALTPKFPVRNREQIWIMGTVLSTVAANYVQQICNLAPPEFGLTPSPFQCARVCRPKEGTLLYRLLKKSPVPQGPPISSWHWRAMVKTVIILFLLRLRMHNCKDSLLRIVRPSLL